MSEIRAFFVSDLVENVRSFVAGLLDGVDGVSIYLTVCMCVLECEAMDLSRKKVVVFAIPADFQRRANDRDAGLRIMIMPVVSRKEGASGSLMVVARLNIIRQKLVEMPSTFHKTETFPHSMRRVHFCH